MDYKGASFYRKIYLIFMQDLENLLEIAIKSEIDAAENYNKMAEMTNIYLLKDKIKFLANEETAHKNLLEKLFKKKFPDRKIVLPEESKISFPEFRTDDKIQLSDILKKAMEAEKMAADFYKEIEKDMEREEEKAIARYLASMEESHYHLLKSELEIAYNFELYDEVHEMMHTGP